MPLTIFFSTPGTYTIDDDGVRGNNTSVVRDSSGTVLFPFAHPGDTIDFIAEVPGVAFVFNTADSFGTANVTVGSLTDTALTPDAIVVRQLRTDAFITLVADGAITEGGSDAAADLTAAGVILSAGTGIGTAGNALDTQVTFLEAETTTGGINLANSGSVQIGGLTPDVAGLDVVTSGNIALTNTGFILLADGTGGSSVHGGDTSGDVTLTALGVDSDIFSNINQKAISAAGGGITLNAGRDVIFGTSGTNFDNDLLATGPIRINAGRDFQLDGTSDVRTGAFGGVVGGAIEIETGRNINLSSLTGGLQTIQAFNGDVLLSTGPGGVFFENAAFPGAVQTTGNIVLNTDNAQINSGGLNTTGIGSVTIRPVTPGRAIDLGTTLDGPAALGLSDDEFDLLFTLNVNIGDANTGPVEFSAPLTPFIVDNLTVQSGTDIVVNSSITLPRSLILRAGDDMVFGPSASFASTNAGFVGYLDQAQDDLGTGGFGSLAGTFAVSTGIQLIGNIDRDTLLGSAGNDTLNGLGGNDTMAGGAGNDIYHVDAAGDVIQEAAAAGTDVAYASLTYTLAAGTHVETLSTSALGAVTAINLTGNELAQTMYGNAGANVLFGAEDNDTLVGLGGNDTLNGGTGNDTMNGGAGNDVFYVDAAGDAIGEAAGGGTDVVYSAVTYTLTGGAEVEALSTSSQTATTAIDLTGNALVQTIYGNAGVNSLNGGGGNDTLLGLGGNDTLNGSTGTDTLMGGTGNDTYHVDVATDVIQEGAGEGTDLAYASVSYVLGAAAQVETLSTSALGATTAINLTGNGFAQMIYGNAGANQLNGLGGNDVLVGLGGADQFVFTTALGPGNVDTISGFVVADDTIRLENAVFTGLALGGLAPGAFTTGAAATQADDRIIYNSATGALLFDVDGTGAAAALQFAVLSTGLAMTASDFIVI